MQKLNCTIDKFVYGVWNHKKGKILRLNLITSLLTGEFLNCIENNLFVIIFRLRLAKILLIGLNGFGAEVAKNIILAGVKSVTLLDHRDLTAQDFCSQFLADRKEIGKNVSI